MANRPIKRIKLGNGITAAIWENQSSKGGVWHSVTIGRCYKDGDKYQETTSFRRDDLLFVAKAAEMAFRWCHRLAERDRAAATQSRK